MKISIGADHRGYALKNYLMTHLSAFSWIDVGAYSSERSDYPLYASLVCASLLEGQAIYGILICGSGVGMAIAANRHSKIYAALCWDEDVARVAKQDDGSNVLVIPSDFVTPEQALKIVQAWLSASFKGGRYQSRLEMIDNLDFPDRLH